MLEKIVYAGVVFVGFLAIMNPIAAISIFLALTKKDDDITSKKIAMQSTLTAFGIVALFAIAGHLLLDIFGVSFTALRLTGGIIVGLIGYEMLQGQLSNVNRPMNETIQKTIEEDGTVAVTPLGIPLLAGPGVIITAMNFSSGGFINMFITIIAFGLLCLITYFTFVFGKRIKEVLGVSLLKVITRMMGLILTVIGMQMLIEGVYAAIREF